MRPCHCCSETGGYHLPACVEHEEETAMKCNHIDRVPLHPSVKIGGPSAGQCENDVLPLLVVCEEHARPEAVRMAMEQLEKACVRKDRLLRDIGRAEMNPDIRDWCAEEVGKR